jgi:dienelactone hydrolase
MKALLPLLALLGPPAAAQEPPPELIRLPPPVGVAQLLRPSATASLLVILLPDALGSDRREDAYRDALWVRGIATLLLGLGEDRELPDKDVEPAAAPEAAQAALAWARAEGFSAVGLLGFGLGGRGALAAGAEVPAVALYPRCRGLPAPAAPALVIQGGEDPEGCAALPPGVTLRLLPGVGHAWDAPGATWPEAGPVLPDPAGGGDRLRARADLAAMQTAATEAAEWLATALRAAPSAARVEYRR